jgi:tetratricopeptide (TPR) repeat protein
MCGFHCHRTCHCIPTATYTYPCIDLILLWFLAQAAKADGNGHFKAQRNDEAVASYSQAVAMVKTILEDDPKNAGALNLMMTCNNNMAAVKTRTKDFTDVVVYATRALEVDHVNPKALYRRGAARLSLRLFNEAADDLVKALDLQPGDQGIRDKLMELKIESASDLIDREPENGQAHFLRGKAYLDCNDLSNAKVDLKKASTLSPENVEWKAVLDDCMKKVMARGLEKIGMSGGDGSGPDISKCAQQ